MEERRKSPRLLAQGQVTVDPAALSVRLLDISAAGVLLQCGQPVEKGTDGRLSLNLDGVPLRASVHVERVAAAEGSAEYRVGATFVALTPAHRQVIQRFIAS